MTGPHSDFRVLLAHPGTQHSFRLARELDRRKCLDSFYTGLAIRLTNRMRHLLPTPTRKWFAARTLPDNFSAGLRRKPLLELLALWQLRRGLDEQEVLQRRNDAFQNGISDDALKSADAIIGFDTASAILADRCRNLCRPFVLDQSIGHPDTKQAMHNKVRRLFPEWGEGFEQRRLDVREKEIREQSAATRIVAASSFTKETLVRNGVAEDKIEIIPYGVDPRFAGVNRNPEGRPFRFAFVGFVTARKGIPVLVEAWKKLGNVDAEMWLIGPVSAAAKRAIPALKGLIVKGPVTPDDVSNLLQQCDAFAFPSFFEGFGLVILEAMASGMPVITTTATAGPDLISEGEDGWILRPGDVDSLTGRMRWCCNHRDDVRRMGQKARAKAEKFSWDNYGERWVEILRKVTSRS